VSEVVSTAEVQRVMDLDREVKKLRRVRQILKIASGFLAHATLSTAG
jgi:transposase-like protein